MRVTHPIRGRHSESTCYVGDSLRPLDIYHSISLCVLASLREIDRSRRTASTGAKAHAADWGAVSDKVLGLRLNP